jgi:dTMP kinase
MSARADGLLAARADHVERVILPALASGAVVLRPVLQPPRLGCGRGLPLDEVEAAVELAAGGLRPDLVVLLDLPVEEGLRRVGERRLTNRLDLESTAFHQRVRDGYLALATREPDRIRVFDAGRPQEELQRAILAAVEPVCRSVVAGSAP